MALEVYEVVCRGSGGVGSGPYVNVYHVHTVDTAINTASVATAFKNFYTAIATIYPTTITWSVPDKITHLVDPPDILPVSSTAVPGSSGATSDPPQIAMVVTWRTAFAGRSFRGRTYLGPLHSASTAGGSFGSSMHDPVQTAATALIAAILGIPGHFMSVLSRFHDKEKRPVPIPFAIGSATVRTTAYTQRRRQIR
jgi:hypothetical protein